MPTTIKLSASSIRQFMTCRRRYWFEYIEELKPLVREVPLSFGSAVHAGLEHLSTVGVFDADCVAKAIAASYTPAELEASELNPALALETVRAYAEHNSAWRRWRFASVEPWFEVSVGHGRRLRGRFDGIIEVDGQMMVLERKTVRGSVSEGQLHHLLWDMQAGLYIMAAREMKIDVRGILYDYIPKPTIDLALATPEDKRKFTKDGKLYANQRDTDETPSEYLARVRSWYAERPECFVQHVVMRNEAQVDALVAQVKMLATDIRAAERDGSWYMNPGACAVMSCPFASVCLEDQPEVRAMNFRQKEARV